MTTIGNWPLLERLTNDEFLKILPHLGLEEYFLTQVFVPSKNWIHLLDANLNTLQNKCCICSRQVPFEDIKIHFTQNDHLEFLHLKQFYHPFYTYGKGDMKLARGEHTPQNVKKTALYEVNMQMESFRKECVLARRFADFAQKSSKRLDEKQVKKQLNKWVRGPDDMIVTSTLPFEDIPKLLFSVVSGEWRPLLRYKNLTKRTTFYCNICNCNCSGIESLNYHLNFYTHKLKQLKIIDLRYEGNSLVNKNCCIDFGNSFSFSMKREIGYERKWDSESWLEELPKGIAKKVMALSEYVPKISTCSEQGRDRSSVKTDVSHCGKFESFKNIGHIGVEYVLKIIKSESDWNPHFECGLCEYVGGDKKMQRHLLLYNHKKKYLDLHYPDTIKKYESLIGHMCYKEFQAVMTQIVFKVAAEIEKHHGRSLPYTVSLSDYTDRRPDLIAKAYTVLHASQNRGPSFSNVVSSDDIKCLKDSVAELLENKSLYENMDSVVFTKPPVGKVYLNQMNHDPVIRLREYNEKLNKTQSAEDKNSLSASAIYDSRSSGSRFGRARIVDQHSRSRTPIHGRTRKSAERTSGITDTNIWNIYRVEIALAAKEIELSYEHFRNNPESHPLYEEEWNKFWQQRKKELEREGYNHRNYNFQPEWVSYFKQRIEVLFGEALHNSKINIRHKLEIPLDAEEDCQHSHDSASQYTTNYTARNNAFKEESVHGLNTRKRHSSREIVESVPQSKKIFDAEKTQEQGKDLIINDSNNIGQDVKDHHSNVIHVLRLITVLEEYLGTLSGSIINLLSTALQMEKKYSADIIMFETQVLTVSNCLLLETAMEKLKGILIAGFLEEKKISVFKKVIQHTANLLKYAERMGWRHENNVSNYVDKFGKFQEHEDLPQSRNGRDASHLPLKKSLSDTLMGLMEMKKKQTHFSNEQFRRVEESEQSNNMERIKTTNMPIGSRELHSGSGLASFDTKLFIDQPIWSEKSWKSELRKAYKNDVTSSNLKRNNFKDNNDTTRNKNKSTNVGSGIGGGITNDATSAQFRNSQIIPNMGAKNWPHQGRVGGNPSQNRLHWNHIN